MYIAVFQTLSLMFKRPIFKRFAEAALSIGSALIFILFYAYLDLRISVQASFARGEIDATAMAQALRIQSFLPVFEKFIRAPQHLFALFGVISFDFMLLVARMRAISLDQRLTHLIEMPQRGAIILAAKQDQIPRLLKALPIFPSQRAAPRRSPRLCPRARLLPCSSR